MIKICIVDDHAIMREGLKKMFLDLESIEVVDEAGSAQELLEKLPRANWDVLILDISLPDRSGIDLLKEIKKQQSKVAILVLTMHDEEQYGFRAFKAGASGFLTKDTVGDLLITAIMKVARGEKYISPNLAEKLVTMISSFETESSLDLLSDREFEVLSLMGAGKLISEIAKQLSLSVKTVSTYRSRILSKLNLQNNAEIIHYCIEHQILEKSRSRVGV